MPTYARTARFRREFRRLDPARQRAFLAMVERFVNSLVRGQFDPTLRVKRVQGRATSGKSAGRLTAEPPSHTDPKSAPAKRT